MIRYPKQEKKHNTAVLYEVNEYIHGRIDYVTDCPFGEKGRYTHDVNKVGALECNLCRYQLKNNTNARVVRCGHEIKKNGTETKKKLFRDW